MKEIHSVNANILASFHEDDTIIPQVEVVLVFSEPQYFSDMAGGIAKQRVLAEARFAATAENLRKLSEKLLMLATEADEVLAATKAKIVKEAAR